MAVMSDEPNLDDNFSRLLRHLTEESLAAQLVEAYRASEVTNTAAQGMKAVLEARLKQLRKDLVGSQD